MEQTHAKPTQRSERYDPSQIEQKWQAQWAADRLYHADIDAARPKYYCLTMLPYPSGDLHVGHWYAMAPSDTNARYRRMQGYNVVFPIGFDAFGLPAENAAIKRKIHPYTWTYDNIPRMRQQLRSMGAMWDWDREVVTCDPEYYKWNQWFFIKMYEMGLAYRKAAMVNWDPVDQTVLANEQVIDGRGDRSGALVERRLLEQWHLKITHYADELLNNLDTMDWPERVKTMQRNWIGRSEGAQVTFHTEAGDPIEIFTTRPDTLWGATFMVLAPEHPLVEKLTTPQQREAVDAYVKQASHQSEIERMAEGKDKTGVFTGGYAINPVNGARIPVWIADYVLITYGTGAIMAVPAHDGRDFEFARRFDLPVVVVIQPTGVETRHGASLLDGATMTEAYDGPGVMANSAGFDGTSTDVAKKVVTAWLAEKGLGKGHVQYRLRDWLFGRQRYWGTPIPMVYCDTCGVQPVRYEDLPVVLPADAEFQPSGQSPLLYHEEFLNTTCPKCGGAARRETDTMDTFVDSSWYQYRYLSPHYDDGPFDPLQGEYWLPVDQYTGGIEHAILHLLYTRFWTKVMRDIGLVDFGEPMTRLYNQGIILGEDGEKMSKSRGNVIAPDALVERYGADTVRLYLMFIGPWDQGGPWSSTGIEGITRFMNRAWSMVLEPRPTAASIDPAAERDLLRRMHQTIREVTGDLEGFRFNTAVAELMKLNNDMLKAKEAGLYRTPAWNGAVEAFVLMLAPFAPHAAEELWARLGQPYSVHQQSWPAYDEALAAEDLIEIPIQVNGKVRARIEIPPTTDEATLREMAVANDAIQKALGGQQPRKVIVVPGRLVNIVA